jgi:hypothetical protein
MCHLLIAIDGAALPSADRARKAQVFAQGRAAVLGAEEPAILQLGND